MRSDFLGLALIVLTLATTLAHESAFAAVSKQNAKTGGNMECTDPAKPIVVGPGDGFVIILPSNRTTGYTWRLAQPIDETIGALR